MGPSIPFVLALSFVALAASTPPNDNCCAKANKNPDKIAACNAFKYPWNRMNSCFGGTGVDCEGVSFVNGNKILQVLLPKQSLPLARPVPGGDPKKPRVYVVTSVGSIAHDLCCHKYPHGTMCNGNNYPILAVLRKDYNRCACANEWRKAVINLVRGRVWLETFELPLPEDYAKDAPEPGPHEVKYGILPPVTFTTDLQPLRPTRLPISIFSFQGEASDQGLMEPAATRRLQAPGGTALDCPSEDPACKLKCSGKTCLNRQTGELVRGCSCSGFVNRVFSFPKGYVAGDSNYCASGKFASIVVTGTVFRKRYGVCLSTSLGAVPDPETVCKAASKCAAGDSICAWRESFQRTAACAPPLKPGTVGKTVAAVLKAVDEQNTCKAIGTCRAKSVGCPVATGTGDATSPAQPAAAPELDCGAGNVCCHDVAADFDIEAAVADEVNPDKEL